LCYIQTPKDWKFNFYRIIIYNQLRSYVFTIPTFKGPKTNPKSQQLYPSSAERCRWNRGLSLTNSSDALLVPSCQFYSGRYLRASISYTLEQAASTQQQRRSPTKQGKWNDATFNRIFPGEDATDTTLPRLHSVQCTDAAGWPPPRSTDCEGFQSRGDSSPLLRSLYIRTIHRSPSIAIQELTVISARAHLVAIEESGERELRE
jgi:hypothetical protein